MGYCSESGGISKEEFANIPNSEDILYSMFVYLNEQDSEIDQKIADLLRDVDFSIELGEQIIEELDYIERKHTINCKMMAPLEVYAKLTHFGKRLIDILGIFLNYTRHLEIVTTPKEAASDWRSHRVNQAVFPSTKFALIERQVSKIKVKLRSPAEDAVFPYFQKEEVLFFPCCLGIKGTKYREPDYLVCTKGKWGILEIVKNTTHNAESDAERTQWFQKTNVQIWPVPYDRCINTPDIVVKEFLYWLENL